MNSTIKNMYFDYLKYNAIIFKNNGSYILKWSLNNNYTKNDLLSEYSKFDSIWIKYGIFKEIF